MAGTINPWNNQIAASNSDILLNAGIHTINMGTDSIDGTINIGTASLGGRSINIGDFNANTVVNIFAGNGLPALNVSSNGGTAIFGAGLNGTTDIGGGGGTGTVNVTSGSGGVDITGGPVTLRSSGTLEVGNLSLASETIKIGTNTSSAHSSFISMGNNLGASSVSITYGSAGLTITPLTAGAMVTSSAGLVSAANGTSGFVLTSTGASTAPTFQATASSSISITGNSGGALTGNAFTFVTANSTPKFAGAGTTETLDFGLSNLVLGSSLPSIAGGLGNVGVGNSALNSVATGASNTALGTSAGSGITGGANNIAIGFNSLLVAGNGGSNVAVGYQSLLNLTSGSNNTVIGMQTGTAYTTSESSNILIGSVVTGTIGDSNTIRIGVNGSGAGQQNACYVAGIDGVNVGSVAKVVTMASNKLGTATITAGSGITVTPGANTITISSVGPDILAYTNVNTTPYVVLLTDEYLSVDASSGPITLQFPNAPTQGTVFYVKDRAGFAGTNNITITSVGGAIGFDGGLTYVMNTAYQSVNLILGQTNYEIF